MRLAIAALAMCQLTTSLWAESRPNVVLISIDTLRADHLPFYGYAEDTMPFVASLAAKGIVFERAIVPLPVTTPSHASMLTGLYPPQHGSTALTVPMRHDVDTLAAAFKRSGYYTSAAVAVSHLGRRFNFDRGFDDFSQPEDKETRRAAPVINSEAQRWIRKAREGQKPFFLFVHYFDCHAPYGWWRGDETDSASLPVAERVRRYDESIRHVDSQIKHLYETLRAAGLLENTIFCITSDHGEQLGEHGLASGHADIYAETIHVPLVVFGEGIPAARIGGIVSTMDIAPSLVTAAGVRLKHATDGNNILPRRGALLDRLLFPWTGSSKNRDRQLLVVGNPWYTRGVAVVTDRLSFIKNFDHVYRDFRVAPLGADSESRGAARSEMKELKPLEDSGDTRRYAIPSTSYAPFAVTVDYIPKDPGCAAEITALMTPGFMYFRTKLPEGEASRLQFTNARLDLVSLSVEPKTCTASLFYRLDRIADAPAVDVTPSPTYLFTILYAERKNRTGDELFVTADDPGMKRNLIDDPRFFSIRSELDRQLRTMYTTIYGRAFSDTATPRVPQEEIDKLKSLGYLF